MAFKDFSIFSSGGNLVYQSEEILAILVGSRFGIIPVKSESNWLKGLGGAKFKANYYRCSIFSSGGHFLHQRGTVLAILVEGHLSNILIKFE